MKRLKDLTGPRVRSAPVTTPDTAPDHFMVTLEVETITPSGLEVRRVVERVVTDNETDAVYTARRRYRFAVRVDVVHVSPRTRRPAFVS